MPWPFNRKAKKQEAPSMVDLDEAIMQDSERSRPGLLRWWYESFSKEEQDYILTRFKPMVFGGPECKPELANIINPDGSQRVQFWSLAAWFLSPGDRSIARRIIEKSEELSEGNILELHFTYSEMIPIYYRDREAVPGSYLPSRSTHH